MQKLILLTACIMAAFFVGAQAISGTVLTNLNAPLPNATVSLHRAKDSVLLRTTISDTAGRFGFGISGDDSLLLKVSAIGCLPQWKTGKQSPVNFILQPADKALTEVVVTAKKPMIEVRPDKVIFNIENSVNAAGNTAFDLLRKSPGVVIDNNDNIALLGTGATIYIDGKPSPLTGKDLSAFLRSLQSTDIESFELIKNPSARYDAAGAGGIINIRLKKNKNYGLNGSINGAYGIGIFAKYNMGLNLNYRNKKLNVFGNYSQYTGNNESYMNLYREQNDSIFDQKTTTISRYNGKNIKAGIDYFLNKKNTIGFMGSVFTDDWKDRNTATTPISSLAGKLPARTLVANNRNNGNKNNINLNLNHHYTDTSGREWNTDLDYGRFTMLQQSLQPNTYKTPDLQTILEEKDYYIVTNRTIDLFTFKSDLEQSFKGGRLSFGIKTSIVHTSNDFDFSNIQGGLPEKDCSRSNRFKLSENINAAYVNYQHKFSKWDLQFGLRLEQTRTNGVLAGNDTISNKNTRRNYSNLFPDFGLSYAVDKNNGLNLNFSRRINRPGYQSLNPFESKLDELTYQKGNPFLKPEYTNSLSITHTFKYTLNTSIGYSSTSDFSAQITDTVEGKRNFIQQRNAGTQTNVYINISYPFSLAKWWNVYASTGANRLTNKVNLGPGLISNLSVNSFTAYLQHTISLPGKMTVEVSGFYNSPSIWGGTFLNRSFWGVDAGLQKKLLKDKALLKLAVSDVFNSMHWQGISRFGGLLMNASGGWESRQLKLNFTYRFGRKEIKSQRSRNTGNDDINKRL